MTARQVTIENSSPQQVCPVQGKQLRLARDGRTLISIDSIVFAGKDGATPDKESGRCSVIVGPNGAGKSVLVKILCALQLPDSGQVNWAGAVPSAAMRHRVGLMLQQPVLFRRSALANLVYALRLTGLDRKSSLMNSRDALEQAGLANVADVPAQKLSGGEQQRVALLRALLLKPDILFLDEATANVDPASTRVIEQQLQLSMSRGLHVVMVSHDQGQVKRMADEVVLLHKGRLVEQAGAQRFFQNPFTELAQRWIDGELLL